MYRTLDTETTGDAETDQVLEVALFPVLSNLVKPSVPVDPRARAVHHITDEELEGAPDAASYGPLLQRELDRAAYVAIHNAEFDVRLLAQTWPELTLPKVVCTYRCALHIWPDAPSHGLQALRYWLGLSVSPEGQAHRAWYDAAVADAVLREMLRNGYELEDLHELTSEPVVLTKCRFGKHRDSPWADVPLDYCHWILRQPDFDADTRHTAQVQIDRRANRYGIHGIAVGRTLVEEQAAQARCFEDCHAGRHLDPENGVTTKCSMAAECRSWAPYLTREVRDEVAAARTDGDRTGGQRPDADAPAARW